jgi:3-deoxy-manno-octulosonate cytidylyltransferase (CMP-KDO synthetase)
MTSKKHTRALDRVYEASKKLSKKLKLSSEDITICIQADEPMLNPKMIDDSYLFLKTNKTAKCTILGMKIKSKDQFYDKNILKIAHNLKNEVMYTSRSPIPYCNKFF